MPDIDIIPVPLFQGLEPYHQAFDNLPLIALEARDEIINDAVDINSGILRDAIGTQGTLSNRLNQSLAADGTLIPAAVDESLHNIAEHTDGSANLDSGTISDINGLGYSVSNPVPYVRMLAAERSKLAQINPGATSFELQVIIGSNDPVTFDNTNVIIEDSDTVTWTITSPSTLKANLAIPLNSAHQHYYDLSAIAANVGNPDYLNYKVTSSSTVYTSGSLRVYVNGIKLSHNAIVYAPPSSGPNGTWTLTGYTENYSSGAFVMSRVMSSSDVIQVDFDTTF